MNNFLIKSSLGENDDSEYGLINDQSMQRPYCSTFFIILLHVCSVLECNHTLILWFFSIRSELVYYLFAVCHCKIRCRGGFGQIKFTHTQALA